MPDAFKPPNVTSLAEVDHLNSAEYPDECVIIEGLVSPSGQGALVRDDDGYHLHTFKFAAWRELDAPITKQEIVVLHPVPQDHDWRGDFPAFSVHRMRVLLSKNRDRAVFNGSLPLPKQDPEWLAIADRLQQPVIIQSKRFGELVFDHSLGWFEGEADWNGEPVQVMFLADENESIGNQLDTAESLWSDQRTWKERIENYATQELLELKNGTWRRHNEPEFTAAEFTARMTLESIHILPDDKFQFWYDDGDLFSEHSIMVGGNLKDGPDDADIHG